MPNVFPVPPDARAARNFSLIAMDSVVRVSMPLYDPTTGCVEGEFGKTTIVGSIAKWTKLAVGDAVATPAGGCLCSWTLFVPGDVFNGQADAVATQTIDVLNGYYQALTVQFDSGSTYNVGDILVPCYDSTLGGIVKPVTPSSVTTRQLACAVGKVLLPVTNGQLMYESFGR